MYNSPTESIVIQNEPLTIETELIASSKVVIRFLTRQKELFKRLMAAEIANSRSVVLSSANKCLALRARSVQMLSSNSTILDLDAFNQAAQGIAEIRFVIRKVLEKGNTSQARIILTGIPASFLHFKEIPLTADQEGIHRSTHSKNTVQLSPDGLPANDSASLQEELNSLSKHKPVQQSL